jgi:two-component system, NtrC family, sensor histidine kinase HydH
VSIPAPVTPDDLLPKLRKLNQARVLFAGLLLASTLYIQLGRANAPEPALLAVHYGLVALVLALAGVYALMLRCSRRLRVCAGIQILADTVTVTLILLATGGFTSPFSFLYLVVVVYSSLMLPRRGTVTVAAACSIQFGLMADLEYFGWLQLLDGDTPLNAAVLGWDHVAGKVVTILGAGLVVALLSSFLSEQASRSRRELRDMEARVSRVEKLAAVGEMAAGLAHEIRNPLASLSGAIQMMRDELRCDPDQERLMRIILREADRLGALVANFLLYARPPAGRPVPVDLERALAETLELFAMTESVHGRVAARLQAQPGIWVEIDPDHLRQVLWNLLTNAAEAIAGPGEIRVELSPAGPRQACLKVADSGQGMTPETLRSIFDPFFSTKPSGTGLGLSIVQRILDACGCRLDVESEPGRGTTFTIGLRRTDPPSDPHRRPQANAASPRCGGPSAHPA